MFLDSWKRNLICVILAFLCVFVFVFEFFYDSKYYWFNPKNYILINDEMNFNLMGACLLFASTFLCSLNFIFFAEMLGKLRDPDEKTLDGQRVIEAQLKPIRVPLIIGLACAVIFTALNAVALLFGVAVSFSI